MKQGYATRVLALMADNSLLIYYHQAKDIAIVTFDNQPRAFYNYIIWK